MGFFSRTYEPGAEHHVRLSDSVFEDARKRVADNAEIREHFAALADEYSCAKYEAHDFPVTEIIGAFLLGYALQEEIGGVPENLRIGKIQLGRKDQIEYQKFVDRYNSNLELIAKIDANDRAKTGFGAMVFSMAMDAAAKGIAKAATGKSADVRWFEKTFVTYLCGDSQKAREYLVKFATDFGGRDDGLVNVVKAIRQIYWIQEFAKYSRSK